MEQCQNDQRVCGPNGGTLPQVYDIRNISSPPETVKRNQLAGTSTGYLKVARKTGIPFRLHGLFDSGDPVLKALTDHPSSIPFEKHLPGQQSPYEFLPKGGWATGDAAAENGLDLRLFYIPPVNSPHGKVLGVVRLGDKAGIGNGFFMSAHGGAVETILDEATAELAKIEFVPMLSTVEARFMIKKVVPLHQSLLVECVLKGQKGIRCHVHGKLTNPTGDVVYATCDATLVDMTPWIQ